MRFRRFSGKSRETCSFAAEAGENVRRDEKKIEISRKGTYNKIE